jgi:hypothetical protein
MTMRFFILCTVLLTGCGEPPRPPAPAPAPLQPVLSMKQLMEWVIDPAADAVWEPVKTIITEQGTKEIAPQTDEQWEAVRHGAATLHESAHLLTLEGRARDRGEWTQAARGLMEAADEALKAVAAKNPQAVFDAGGRIYNACSACHRRYAPQLNADSGAR